MGEFYRRINPPEAAILAIGSAREAVRKMARSRQPYEG
jgi:hypothetical protein